MLERAGFEQIERAGFNRSRHELLDGTDSHDPGELEPLVVCVDAVKPSLGGMDPGLLPRDDGTEHAPSHGGRL